MTDVPIVETGPGATPQGLADHPGMMVVAFRFGKQGAEGPLHSHPHVQSTFINSGRFRFTVGDDTIEVAPGDSFVVPSGATHGCVCLEPGTLVDCFTPRRDGVL